LDLASRIRDSDHRAYAELFKRTHAPLLRYVFRFTGSEARALDVVQDVFLKLWEQREKLDIRISVKAFLYTMARHRALNTRRNDSRQEAMSDEALQDLAQPAVDDLDTALDARELDRCFRTWIRQLPPRRAEAFVLSRFHELSHREISAIMGLSKRTVDTHIVHALRFLKERYACLKERGIRS
jgi:RNA polymerase sigma-70 factor (ECF subfamily)